MRRLRRKNGTPRRSAPTMGFRWALPRRPRAFDSPVVPLGKDCSPSGPKIQARSAVSFEKKLLITSYSPQSLSDGCRPQIATPRSPAVGRCSRGRVFHHLLRQGSHAIAVSLPENRQRTFGIDQTQDANSHLVCPCRHDHARPCPPCYGISPRNGCGQVHPRLETMDSTRPRVRMAARFF